VNIELSLYVGIFDHIDSCFLGKKKHYAKLKMCVINMAFETKIDLETI